MFGELSVELTNKSLRMKYRTNAFSNQIDVNLAESWKESYVKTYSKLDVD